MGGPPDLNDPKVNHAIEQMQEKVKAKLFGLLNRDEEFKKIVSFLWDYSTPLRGIHDEPIVPGVRKTVDDSLPPTAGQVIQDNIQRAVQEAAEKELRGVPQKELLERLEKATDPAERERLKHEALLRALGDH